ncbi:hypothetical protein C6499_19160 [Candidatus Poribacteria bacterium]|nr:MAG: hypothetical protein C6499_19160 [Candidatus Poribacteria bacterium]
MEQNLRPAKALVQKWVEENPNGWMQFTMREMAHAMGVSLGAVNQYLYEVIAERDGITPTEAMRRRKAQTQGSFYQSKIDRERVQQLHDAGMSIREIAYTMQISNYSVRTILKEISDADTDTGRTDSE